MTVRAVDKGAADATRELRVGDVEDDREGPGLESGPDRRVAPDGKAQVLDGRDPVLAALSAQEPTEDPPARDLCTTEGSRAAIPARRAVYS